MSTLPGLTAIGPAALQKAITEQPALTLAFYTFGIIMRKTTVNGMTEYPVSPEDVVTAFAAKVSFNTGLILPNTICILSEGTQRVVVEYRPPQKTALWLEGSDDPVHVPLPGLLMVRHTTSGKNPAYRIHAVTERPLAMDAPLYRAPLPNIDHGGAVCWGTVTKVKPKVLAGNDLREDWAQLLGTPFGGHSVHGKTKTHGDDIRKFYMALEKRKARVFPKRELIAEKQTLGKALALPGDGLYVPGLRADDPLVRGLDDEFEEEDDE